MSREEILVKSDLSKVLRLTVLRLTKIFGKRNLARTSRSSYSQDILPPRRRLMEVLSMKRKLERFLTRQRLSLIRLHTIHVCS